MNHEKLIASTESLRAELARFETRNVLAKFAMYVLDQVNRPEAERVLMSPARQLSFATSLLLATPEPKTPQEFDGRSWNNCVQILNDIFDAYAHAYWPKRNEHVTPKWRDVREVAMLAFLHYFNTGICGSTDQLRARIARYLTPFDRELTSIAGISATDALRICDSVLQQTKKTYGRLITLGKKERSLRQGLSDDWQRHDWQPDTVRRESDVRGYTPILTEYLGLVDALLRVDHERLLERFGGVGQAFWDLFSVRRGEAESIKYLTQEMPYDSRPLVRFNDQQATLITPHDLYVAVLTVLEARLRASSADASYLRHRDKALETESAELFGKLLPGATIHRSVFETQDAHFEHDIVVLVEDACIVVEAKASPAVEPFRDPEKAFERVSRAFKSDRGIQKAYDQAARLWQKWASGAVIPLYRRNGTVQVIIDPSRVKRFLLVCVTRASFGMLATNLTLLLEKPLDAPYAWVPDVLSLGFMVDAWRSLGMSTRDFLRFLEQRERLHGKVVANDELEMAGYYVRHGSMERLIHHPYDTMLLDSKYDDVFEGVWRAKHGDKRFSFVRTEPVELDLREQLGSAPLPQPLGKPPTQGRNDRCSCGSGLKHKRCCGK